MVKVFLAWKVLQMPFDLLASLIDSLRFNTIREYLKGEENYDMIYVSEGRSALFLNV